MAGAAPAPGSAEIVLGLSLLVVSLELIGVVGLYRPGWVLLGTVAAGVGVGLWASRGDWARLAELPAPPLSAVGVIVAIGASMLVAAHWSMPTQTGLDIGMYLPNTTWHNARFAARFVQDAQVGALHMTEVLKLTVWFYPQNSELLHSFGILFLGSDFLSPLINIGWMCLCLLAAWSFGRPYGAAATALLGVAILLDAEMLLLFQPGDAKNDVGGLFFLLAAAAILVNGDAQSRAATQAARPAGFVDTGTGLTPIFPRGALIVAGLAAGLALGTKLNLLAPFGLLTLGVIAVARPGDRLRTACIWVGASLTTGGFWFARNLVEAGNPLPWADVGPLPGPEQLDIDIREPATVSDYLTNGDVITDFFIPGLNDSFGVLWPVVLAGVAGGFVLAIWRGRTSMIRMLGVVALLSGIAYLFTPLTAAGPAGEPSAFEVNLRYASPALALGRPAARDRPRAEPRASAAGPARRAVAGARGRALQRRRERLGPRLPAGSGRADAAPGRDPGGPGTRSPVGHRPMEHRGRRGRGDRRSPSASAGSRATPTSTTATGPRPRRATSPRASAPRSPGSTRRSPPTPGSRSSAAAPASSSTSSTATTSRTASSTSPTTLPTAGSCRSPPARSGAPR